MSSLIFHTDELQAFVATDTLAISDGEKPYMFTTKAFAVPHLKMVMCGTGIGGFLGQWFIQVNDRMIVPDIDHLNAHTPHNLASGWRKYKEEIPIPDSETTTVYHFGFSRDDNRLHAYVYRSKNNFKSEVLPYGFGSKPPCRLIDHADLTLNVKAMMDEQRRAESLRPPKERVWIGGEIIVYHLTVDGCLTYALEKFDDFDETEKAIYENFDKRRHS